MTTMTYSEKILLALAQHGQLNARQISNQISHDQKKTAALIQFMAAAGKVQPNGAVDGLTTYCLTALGRTLATRLGAPLPQDSVQTSAHQAEDADVTTHLQQTEPAAPAPSSLEDLAFRERDEAPQGRPVRRVPAPRAMGELDAVMSTDPRFGLLDSGELIILRGNLMPIVFGLAATARLRTMLAGGRQ